MTDPAKHQRILRIHLAICAYAYEILNESIVSDKEYDEASKAIDLSIRTGADVMDDFFEKHFTPDSGMWIHKHPNLKKIGIITRAAIKTLEKNTNQTKNQ